MAYILSQEGNDYARRNTHDKANKIHRVRMRYQRKAGAIAHWTIAGAAPLMQVNLSRPNTLRGEANAIRATE